MPALLKAFLEQVMRPGVAFEYTSSGTGLNALLKGRSARLIVTMGMPAMLYRLWFLNHGIATLRRGILNIVGIRPVRQTFFGTAETASDTRRKRWLAKARHLGQMAM
jgi:putative NADPH-quinone reductase